MKVLISPVGLTDPRPESRPQELGPALSILDYTQPDIVFLLPTMDRVEVGGNHTMERSRRLEGEIVALFPGARIHTRPYDLTDPSDFHQVLRETERLFRLIEGECSAIGGCEFFVNVTSGTPQMEASLLLAAAVGALKITPVQSRNPRFLPPGEARVRPVTIRPWAETIAIDRARQLFGKHEYAACAQEVEFLCATTVRTRRPAAANLHQLSSLYENVHHINYREANEALNGTSTRGEAGLLSAVRGLPEYAPALQHLDAQSALLARLPQAHHEEKVLPGKYKETPEFLADIYHNAARCAEVHAYADCLARVWRTLEGMFYIRLRAKDVEPTDVRASVNQDLSRDIVKFLRRENDERKVDLTLGTANWLFDERLDDREYQALRRETFPGTNSKVERVANWVRDARNHSVAGHNSLPVNREKAERGLVLARLMLERLVPGIDLDGHPFAPGPIAQVGKVFFDALGT